MELFTVYVVHLFASFPANDTAVLISPVVGLFPSPEVLNKVVVGFGSIGPNKLAFFLDIVNAHPVCVVQVIVVHVCEQDLLFCLVVNVRQVTTSSHACSLGILPVQLLFVDDELNFASRGSLFFLQRSQKLDQSWWFVIVEEVIFRAVSLDKTLSVNAWPEVRLVVSVLDDDLALVSEV